jgi:hypothetical protein
MLTLDAQVHTYERDHPGRPWLGTLYGPAEVTGDQMVAAMDACAMVSDQRALDGLLFRRQPSTRLIREEFKPDQGIGLAAGVRNMTMPTTMTERDLSRPHSSIDESWGMLIHDVRNPQATVHAYVQLLRRRRKNAPIDVLAQSVRAAARGEVQFSPADARLLVVRCRSRCGQNISLQVRATESNVGRVVGVATWACGAVAADLRRIAARRCWADCAHGEHDTVARGGAAQPAAGVHGRDCVVRDRWARPDWVGRVLPHRV